MSEKNPARKKVKRLTPREWAEIEFMWARGEHTQKQLAEKFGIRPETISQKMRARGVIKGEKTADVLDEMETALEKKERNFAEKRADRLVQTREEMYSIIRALTLAVARVYKEAQDKNEPMGVHLNNVKALKEAIAAVKLGREEVYAILAYDPDEESAGNMPALLVRAMTDAEEEEIRRQQEEEDAELIRELDLLKENEESAIAADESD